MSGNDKDLILKCNNEQWIKAADWQSKVMHYMIEEKGVEVIFSHMHNVDLQSHNYMKYMKNRDTSRYDESEVVKFAEATYKVTDDYLGSFMHLLDEGWSILLFSDHALISAEEEAVSLGDNTGVCMNPFKEWGYTVLKKDENGKELYEIDDEDLEFMSHDYVTYNMACEYYRLGMKPVIRMAHEAGAVYKIGKR